MINDSMLLEKIDYYAEHFMTKEKHAMLHPIDQLLLANHKNKTISTRWFNVLKLIGIDYTTPCRWLRNPKDWNKYVNNINSTVLSVSDGFFLVMSQGSLLIKHGKSALDPEFTKDKEHMKCGRLVFAHSISSKDYLNLVIGKC